MTDQQIARTATRAVLATRLMIVAALVLGATIIGLQLATTLQIRSEQKVGAERGRDIKSTADAIKSCTTPDMECFKRGQEATAQAVGSINQAAVYAAACAADVPRELPVRQRVRIIEKCITKLAEQRQPQTQQ